MVYSESKSIANGVAKSESPPQTSQEIDNSISSLNKQNSIFSLTLDEIQFKSGKNFGSMNMDEFIANLWSTDENQVSTQSNQSEPKDNKSLENQPIIAQQGSFEIPTPLCKKTVDEIWFEIQKDQPQLQQPNINSNDVREPIQRQQTYGEITLEDFLVKAGVVRESRYSRPKMATSEQNNNTCRDDASFGMGQVMETRFPSHPQNMFCNGYATTYPVFTQSKTFVGESSNGIFENGKSTQGLADSNGLKSKKRIVDGLSEVVVERRYRRMIKNRESAARSRARKQAYTVELELELNQLKEENEKLKQVLEENEKKRKEEVMKRKQSITTPKKKTPKLKTIRRTVSLDW